MPNPNDADSIPSHRSPDKRQAEFPTVENDTVTGNGQRTMPRLMEQQIETWARHGKKIIDQLRTQCFTVVSRSECCVICRDPEKTTAILTVLESIDRKRKEAHKAPTQ